MARWAGQTAGKPTNWFADGGTFATARRVFRWGTVKLLTARRPTRSAVCSRSISRHAATKSGLSAISEPSGPERINRSIFGTCNESHTLCVKAAWQSAVCQDHDYTEGKSETEVQSKGTCSAAWSRSSVEEEAMAMRQRPRFARESGEVMLRPFAAQGVTGTPRAQ